MINAVEEQLAENYNEQMAEIMENGEMEARKIAFLGGKSTPNNRREKHHG